MDKVIKRESRDTEVREDVAKKWQPASLLPDFDKKAGGPTVGFEFLY